MNLRIARCWLRGLSDLRYLHWWTGHNWRADGLCRFRYSDCGTLWTFRGEKP